MTTFVRFDVEGRDVATQAARKAARLYPGVVGEVLSAEILSLTQFSWLGASSRAARLMHAITDIEEESE